MLTQPHPTRTINGGLDPSPAREDTIQPPLDGERGNSPAHASDSAESARASEGGERKALCGGSFPSPESRAPQSLGMAFSHLPFCLSKISSALGSGDRRGMCHAEMALRNIIPAPWKVPLSPSLDLGLCSISPEYFLASRVSPNPQ